MRKAALVGIAFLVTATAACGTGQPTASGPSSTSDHSSSSVAAPSSSVAASSSSVTAPSSSAPAQTSSVEPTPSAAPEPTAQKTPTPQPAPPPPAVPVEGTPCDITEGACVRLSTNESWLISGGKVEYGPVPITAGRPSDPTPTGYFSVLYKVQNERSREFNDAPMPYTTYFAPGGIGFHEGSLYDQSHGCIHLSMDAAITYFNSLEQGEQVQVVA
ncbi:L,D-transpeptidase [Saccharothrix variisporea]|uniref:Lipoprotein-anchoring transpeptidase ErfK/SrfK n=1 Tax=Saccharothrix variisporea TaxID=543527 RepID=A0A495XDL4_9PSEU|nr:L,D-transpeptidase [Saccharothrix variisporea]RKT70703.1 lipoprotein-anchoring transpeptidase ErfK/SrfK [Saccharothrix variisporea]